MFDEKALLSDLVLHLNNKYIASAVIVLGFTLISIIVLIIFEKIVLKIANRTKTNIDDMVVKAIHNPISGILFLVGIRLGSEALELPKNVFKIISEISLSCVYVLVLYIVTAIIVVLLEQWGMRWAAKTESTIDDHIISFLQRFTKIAFVVVSILVVLATWGVQIGPLLASLGIAGIAVAFALQNTLGNVFGGISMVADKSVKVGDIVKIDNDTQGTVMDVGLRSTKVRSFDNEVFVIPNGQLSNQKIQNFILPDPRVRVQVKFSVAYGSKIERVKELMLKEISSMKECLPEPAPMVRFDSMGDSALNFRAFFWVKDFHARFSATDEANTRIYNLLNKHKISIPFPQMDLHIIQDRKPKRRR